jgi:5-oxoprolinase (ATP-hydrolysing)
MQVRDRKWKFAIDRGGTFTDVIALDPAGRFRTLKLLSNSSAYRDASIEGMRRMPGLREGAPLPHVAGHDEQPAF